MRNEKVREFIAEQGYSESLLFDQPSFDNSIIGVSDDGRIVYDYEAMSYELAAEFIEEEMNSEEKNPREIGDFVFEALEFIDYNTMRALPYGGGCKPLVIGCVPDEEENLKCVDMLNYDEIDTETIPMFQFPPTIIKNPNTLLDTIYDSYLHSETTEDNT